MRISPLMVAVYAVVSLVGGLIVVDSAGSPWEAALVYVTATAASVALLVILGAVAHRIQGPRPMGVLLLPVAALLGIARAVALIVVAAHLHVPVNGSPVSVVVSSGFSAIVWLGLVGVLVAGQDAYREDYRAIVQKVASIDLDADLDVQQMRSTISTAAAAAANAPSPEEWSRTSQAIRSEISLRLRPLSHRLWFGAPGEEPHARWLRVVRDATTSFSVPIAWLVPLWGAGALIGGIALFGVTRAIVAAALSTAALLAALLVAKSVVAHFTKPIVGVVAILLSSLLPILATDAAMTLLGFDSSLTRSSGLGLLLWLALAGMIVLAASAALAASDRRAVLAAAAAAQTTTGERVSSYLHNGLQSELTGLAMQLDGAARSDDPVAAREALERLASLLTRSFSEDLASFHESPSARAARVAEAWRGICDVRLDLAPDTDDEALLARAVTAAEELISNAVRHTAASHVEVTICPAACGGLCVVCRTNSPGETATGSGLGTHLLSAIAPGGVTITHEARGSIYSLLIPASPRV
jgi:signal transduction histidine kinase